MYAFRPTGNPITDIPAFVAMRGDGLTFVELVRWLPYLRGAGRYTVAGNPSLLIWSGLSDAAIGALHDLEAERLIHLQPTNPLTYVLDGFRSKVPVAASRRQYRSLRWLPVTLAMSAADRARLVPEPIYA